jgi:hypothetical protein
MDRKLRIISLDFELAASTVSDGLLTTERALFDFDVVVVRPPDLSSFQEGRREVYHDIASVMSTKKRELGAFFEQGGVLVVFIAPPVLYKVEGDRYGHGSAIVDNYDFLDERLALCLRKGTGNQVVYATVAEPFIGVLKKSTIAWTSYLPSVPSTFTGMKFFAHAGKAGALAGKMQYGEGHIIFLPNVTQLDEKSFVEACAEYRFKRQGTTPPNWVKSITVPGIAPIESSIASLDGQIAALQSQRLTFERELEGRSDYRKLLYEKGKTQLEPIVLRALDQLDFGSSPSETIKGTSHEIDGRTSNGSSPGIVEVKGSKNQIVQSEFSPFVTKLLADSDTSNTFSKGILVGNGLCETTPAQRVGNAVFSPHVLDGAKRHSIALVNSVELYWLCCALMRGDHVDKVGAREAILNGSGYIDLKPFCGEPVFTA